jgi:hypothetical protein
MQIGNAATADDGDADAARKEMGQKKRRRQLDTGV